LKRKVKENKPEILPLQGGFLLLLEAEFDIMLI